MRCQAENERGDLCIHHVFLDEITGEYPDFCPGHAYPEPSSSPEPVGAEPEARQNVPGVAANSASGSKITESDTTPAGGEPVGYVTLKQMKQLRNSTGLVQAWTYPEPNKHHNTPLYAGPAEGEGARAADVLQLVHDSAALVAENDRARAALGEIRDAVKVNTSYADFVGYLQAIAIAALASQPAGERVFQSRYVVPSRGYTGDWHPCTKEAVGELKDNSEWETRELVVVVPASPERKEPDDG